MSYELIARRTQVQSFNRMLLISMLGFVSSGACFAETAQTTKALKNLKANISALLDQPKFAAMRWGIAIMTVGGQVLFERDADKALIPASNIKLFTTAVALDSLGHEATFRTSVYASRPVHNGVVQGDLIFYGRGDPGLGSRFDLEKPYSIDSLILTSQKNPHIEKLADQIKARGIKLITGNLIGDDSFFATKKLPSGWEWEDAQAYYGAEISALSVNDNYISYTVSPTSPGKAPIITMQPQTAYVTVSNNACTVDSVGALSIAVHRPLTSNAIEFSGSIPYKAKEYKIALPVHDPACFAATLLQEALARRGIRVAGQVCRIDARSCQPYNFSKMTEVAHLTSQPLSTLIKVINKISQNLHAEILLRHIGATQGGIALDDAGRPKSVEMIGNDVRKAFIQAAGIDLKTLNLRDGSGLARHNLLTPRATARLLQFMLSHPHGEVFRDSLSIAGVDGVLEQRMKGTAAANNVRAKTGTLAHVSALSGYVTTKRGQPLIVSFMANNYVGPAVDVTTVFDQICALLANYEG